MNLQIDHVIIAVDDLDRATAEYTAAGFTVLPGGIHASGTTHNALICFADGSYLELLAAVPQAPAVDLDAFDFSFLLREGAGLTGYALGSGDLSAAVTAMRGRGVLIGDPLRGSRQRPDGVQLAWSIARIEDRNTPFLIQDLTPRPLRVPDDASATTHANGTTGIASLHLITAQPAALSEFYQRLLGQPPVTVSPEAVVFAINERQMVVIAPPVSGIQPPLTPDAPHGLMLDCDLSPLPAPPKLSGRIHLLFRARPSER